MIDDKRKEVKRASRGRQSKICEASSSHASQPAESVPDMPKVKAFDASSLGLSKEASKLSTWMKHSDELLEEINQFRDYDEDVNSNKLFNFDYGQANLH
jgi:hypothetical protein